ncbi:MAG TPA: nuclear transport factor 2 family protein [Flavitalea sp.]|nr:nuclear transport factor 2 family protein [Flavitalea sp.]HTF32049.1 nuclear transport factor 2 family protein [Flavitalea sp.]
MRTILFFMLAAYVAGCNSTQTSSALASTSFNLDSVKTYITEMNKSYGQRFKTNDTAFYKERYCKDAAVYCPNVPAVVGIDSIISFFYGGGNNTETIIELPPNNISGNADLVVEDGPYNFPDGKGGSVDKGKFIALWKQEDGKWKLYREIWNTDLPPSR